jgi:hypothetical protein
MTSASEAVSSTDNGPVNYESEAIVELTIEELEYRVDAGKQGTALCVSTRAPGGWDWQYCAEVRFDGRDVSSKVLDRQVRVRLGKALQQALEDQAGAGS